MNVKRPILYYLISVIFVNLRYYVESQHHRAAIHGGDPGSPERWRIVENGSGEDAVATAEFSDQINTNGWSFLRVVTNGNYSDEDQAYAAGLLEGNLTCQLMSYRWVNCLVNMCNDTNDHLCHKLWDYLDTNKRWMEEQVQRNVNSSYWHQVELMMKQIQGLQDGCQINLSKEKYKLHQVQIDFAHWFLSLMFETYDLMSALRDQKVEEEEKPGSCSAMIKWVQDEREDADLLVAHVTWNYYSDMLRILKNYEFNFHLTGEPGSALIPGYNMTFSSYPGCLHSMDDFHLISSGLVTLETTISIYNDSLWEFVSPTSGVHEFIRTMVANRLATSGQMWTQLFAKHNGGTYNNQWMIVDYNKFSPLDKKLQNGLLWIIEQLPGYTKAEDRTDTLRDQGYWPSFNIPYFPSVYNLSGQAEEAQKYGRLHTYEENPRYLIFERNQSQVINLDTMYDLLRSNDYLNDPFAICQCTPTHNAILALSARADLNPVYGVYPQTLLRHMAFGAIDLKVTNYELFQNLQFVAVSSPPYESESLTPFDWSTYEDLESVHPFGQPVLWKFEPVLTNWQ